jgi:A/G-specific adenine glycosylase
MERDISVKIWSDAQVLALRGQLLDWYDHMGRSLPWRVRPEDYARGIRPEPYAVWLSEIMLQQTTVPHAAPYWEKFLRAFPRVSDLANAEREQVMAMWAGLGYYARARNLYKCAQLVRDDYNGQFPQSEAELLTLPGIGPYTAAAIAGICYNEPTVVVDGNVERVMSRMARIETPLPKGKKDIKAVAAQIADPLRSGDYSQALMDLGATICTPRAPKCHICVWQDSCTAHRDGVEENYPKKIKKKPLPKRYGAVFVLRGGGQVLLRQRPDQGLLGGMLDFPGSEWTRAKPKDALRYAPLPADWTRASKTVTHIFTHFELTLDIYTADLAAASLLAELRQSGGPNYPYDGDYPYDIDRFRNVNERSLKDVALPSVMQKVWRIVLG